MTTHCHCLLLIKHKQDKTHKKTTKKNQEKKGSLLSSSRSTLSILAFAFALLFQMLSLGIFFFSSRKKKKKNHIEEKICRERKELTFKLPFCPLIFGSHFYLPTFAFPFQVFSFSIFFFSRRRKEKKNTKKKKKTEKKKK